MNKTLLTLITGLGFTASVYGQTLFSDNFEGQTVGQKPTGTAVRPITNSATVFSEIVTGSANEAGGGVGNGLELFDNDSGSAFTFENNFVADTGSQKSAVHIYYDLAWGSNLGSSQYGRFGVGAYDATTGAFLNTSGNLFLEIRWGGDGVFMAKGSSGNSTTNFTLGQGYAIDIYVNDYASQSIDYTAPGGGTVSLPADSFAVYVDQVLLRTDGLTNGALVGDANLGRLGVDSFGASVGIDYTTDNWLVENIAVPEPRTYAVFAGLLALGLVALKRRR